MKLYLFVTARNRETGVPYPVYLIRTDEGKNVLVDSGMPLDLSSMGERTATTEVGPGGHVVDQLAALGLKPAAIDILVSTHFDWDHAANHALFANAEGVVQRAHHEAAVGGLPRLQVMRAQWDDPALRYRLLDGDTELLPGIELIESGGHVPGHQAVLVRLPNTGPVLLAIDAIASAAALDPDTREIAPYDMDEAGTRASTRKLVDLARREGVNLLVHGHDAAQWATLKLSPAYYD